MNKSVLLGMASDDMEQTRSEVEVACRVQLSVHQSDYRGGDYFCNEVEGVKVILQENYIEDDGEPTEAAFPAESLIMYLDGPADGVDKLCCTLQRGIALIKTLRSNSY